jgi:hypothetical protein
MTKVLYILTILLTTQCASVSTTSKEEKSDLQIVYTVDKDGLFLYDLKTGTEKKIYSTDQVFLDKKMELINDSILLVGHQNKSREEERERLVYSKYLYRADGDSTFITDNPPYKTFDKHVFLTEVFFAINLNNGSNRKYKTMDYEHIEHATLKIRTSDFDNKGNIVNEHDTTITCSGTSSSYKGLEFCDFERYFSKSEIVNDRQLFSRRGDLYLINQLDTTLLLKFDGHFDPKFGSGYYRPTISSDGRRISYQYLAGFLKKGSAIYAMDIDTKQKRELIGEDYFNPVYSPDGQKLLIAKNQRQAKKNTWINTIYVLDIETGKTKKIGNGTKYLWKPK